MRIVNKILIYGVGTAVLAIAPPPPIAAAQRGGQPTRPQQGAAKADTGKKSGDASVGLDFQDQDLKVVLDALVAAGDLNASMTNIPSTRVTLHLGRPVTRDGMIELIKSVAESNGLKVTASPTLIQITGPTPEPAQRQQSPQQLLAEELLAAQQQQQSVRLYTYRLKHASAVQLAPVLTSLFTGYNGGQNVGRTITIPNGNGGFTTIQTPANVGGPPGNISTIQTPFAAGRGGGRGQAANTAAFEQLAGALSGQAGDIRIIAEESSNSLLIRATQSDWALIEQVISGVDLRPLQVLIEVTIAEVSRTHDLDVGVTGAVVKTTHDHIDSTFAPSVASARDFIFQLTGGHGTINYNVAISALQERGDLRVLSLPVIIAQNNRQASLNVGSSQPFVQVSQTVPADPTSRVETVQYIDVGTVLTITPTINPDGYVNLQVTQTDNSVSNQIQFDAPVINKREATTQIFIRDGQTTVIGGLADNTHSSDVSGIPFLSRIPIIGPFLFGSVTKSSETNELFLFLTPHIISSDEDMDKLREAVRNQSEMLQQVNIGPHFGPPIADTLIFKPQGDTSRKAPADTNRKPPADTTRKPDSLKVLRPRPPEPDSLTPSRLPLRH